MENVTTTQEQDQSITLTNRSLEYLRTTRKWTMFLSILGFVLIGILLTVGMVMISSFSMNSPIFPVSGLSLFIIYLIIAVIYFFPIFFLYRFSVRMKMAVELRSAKYAEKAFCAQKNLYVFIGILTIAMLILYPSILVFVLFFRT